MNVETFRTRRDYVSYLWQYLRVLSEEDASREKVTLTWLQLKDALTLLPADPWARVGWGGTIEQVRL